MNEIKRSNIMKTREAVLKLKFGSPKAHEIIRAKCRLRLREARRKSFDTGRNMTNLNDLHNVIGDILLDELLSVDLNIKSEDEFLRELLMQDQTPDEDYLDQLIEQYLMEGVMCPCCEKYFMRNDRDGFIICNCGVKLRQGNMKDFENRIMTHVEQHSRQCDTNPQFIFVPEEESQNLIMICANCNYNACVY